MKVTSVLALIAFTARRVFAGRRAWATLVVLAVAPLVSLLLALLVREESGAPPFFDGLTFGFLLHVSLLLTALIHGAALTSGELEDGTAGYLLLAGLPRWMIALVHVLVTATVLALLTFFSVAATYLLSTLSPAGSGMRPPGTIAGIAFVAWVGLGVFLAFFVFCGYAFRHNIAVSVASVLLWEFLVAALPIKFAAFTVTMNLRVLWLHFVLQGQRSVWFRNVVGYDLPSYGETSMFLSVTLALFLTLGMAAAMNRSIVARESA